LAARSCASLSSFYLFSSPETHKSIFLPQPNIFVSIDIGDLRDISQSPKQTKNKKQKKKPKQKTKAKPNQTQNRKNIRYAPKQFIFQKFTN
jgi:hypothetical protein